MNGIKKILARRGLVDSLTLTVEIDLHPGVGNLRMFLTRFDGVLAFYRKPVDEGQLGREGGVSLRAEWVPGTNDVRVVSRRQEAMTFAVDLHHGVLDKIEEFRGGDPLFVRLEGRFQYLSLGTMGAGDREPGAALLASLIDSRQVMWLDIKGECLELRDRWIADVLGVLRDSYHVVLEAMLPATPAVNEAGRRALAYFTKAQANLDEGRYEDSAAATFKAIEAIQTCVQTLERYGSNVQGAVKGQCSSITRVANDIRHDPSNLPENRTPPTIDRALARHLLVSAKSLFGFVFSA